MYTFVLVSFFAHWLFPLLVLAVLASAGWHIGGIINDIAGFIQHLWLRLFGHNFAFYPDWEKQKIPAEKQRFLYDQLFFYKHLTPDKRRVFDYRVLRFMQSKKFVAKQGVELTEDMKLLISATSVQITFGLRTFMLNEFNRIIIFPDIYYNPHVKQHHKGEVTEGGTVILSWRHFKEGIAIPDDNLNLGIHEFAHTLALQRLNNNMFRDVYFVKAFDKLMRNVSNPMFRKRIIQRAQIRNYAMTNPMEFFAVATEYFFESPQELKRRHHTIYQLFVEMYNQDLVKVYAPQPEPITQ